MLRRTILFFFILVLGSFAARADDSCVERVEFFDSGMIKEATRNGPIQYVDELGASFRQYFLEDVKEAKQKGLAEDGTVVYFNETSGKWEKSADATVGAGGVEMRDGIIGLTPDLLEKFPMGTLVFSEAFPGKTFVVGDIVSNDKKKVASVWRDDESKNIGSRAGNLCRKD